jgi:hypothetical protein
MLALSPAARAAVSNVAWLQGSALEDGSISLTTTTPTAIQWTETSSIDPTVFQHELSTATKLVVKKDGDYLVAVTTPFISLDDADLRPTQATEVYVNGELVPGALSQSSYIRNQPRNANMQRESSNHIQALLKGLQANDVIEVKVHKTSQAAVATSLQSGSLYVELLPESSTVFAALSSGPTTGSNLNPDLFAGETPAQLAWTSVRKDAGFTHTDGSANISLGAGAYLVFVNLPIASASAERTSPQLEVTLNGAIVPGGRARQGYIRRTGGHNVASVHWAGLVQVTGTQTLTLQTIRMANAGEVTIESGKQASLYIEKLDSASGIFFSLATSVADPLDPGNWNPANKTAIVWDINTIIDTALYSHDPLSSTIQVKQRGNYLLVYNDQLQSTGARVNPRITVEINGQEVRGAETKTHYIRSDGGHNHSSACLVFLLENLETNDPVTISTQREGNTQFVAIDETSSEGAILALIKKDTLVLPPGDMTPPRVTYFSGNVLGFEARIADLGLEIDPASVAATVNGAPIIVASAKVRGVTTVTHSYTDFPPAGSLQRIGISFKDTATPPGSHLVTLEYTVTEPFTEIPPSFAATGVDTTQSGFIANVTQISEAQTFAANNLHGNLIAGAEQQLRGGFTNDTGAPFLNEAGPQTATSWVIVPENVEIINFEQAGLDAGNFTPDNLIPRIPGWGFSDNGIVAEFLTFLELKKGFHILGVNSDDGFQASIGPSHKDLLARKVGFLDAGRAAADSLFNVVIKEDGIYPFRLLWFEGGGAASVELFSVQNGEKILVNDRSNPNAIKAYRVGPARPYITKVEPGSGRLAQRIEFEIVDDVLKVVPGSVKLSFDGAEVAAEIAQNNGVTTVVYDAGAFFTGGDHSATLTFDENSTPPATRSVIHQFNIPKGQIAVLLDEPFAYWRFGETSGDRAFSEVGRDLTARYFGGPTLGAERVAVGDPTPAVLLDKASSQWIDIPDHRDINTTTGPWQFKTIELWFKARNVPTSNPVLPGIRIPQRQVIYEQGGATRGMNIYLSGTQPANPAQAELWLNLLNRAEEAWGGTLPDDDQGVSPNGTPVAVKTTIEANKPYHLVLVMEGDNLAPDSFAGKLIGYLNGEKFGESPGVHLLYNHTDDIGVGARNEEVAFHDYIVNGAGTFAPEIIATNEMFFFDGWIDELALYNTALSPERVQAHYQAGITTVPPEEPPVGELVIDSIQVQGGNVRVEWQGAAALQQATSVTGPFSNIPGAASPFTAPIIHGENRFYRLAQ